MENLRDLRPRPNAFGSIRGHSFGEFWGDNKEALDNADPDVRLPQELTDKLQQDARELEPEKMDLGE